MGEWLVILGAAAHLAGTALMFGDLMELKARRDDPGAVDEMLHTGVVGNRWARWAVQVLVIAGLLSITIGVIVGW